MLASSRESFEQKLLQGDREELESPLVMPCPDHTEEAANVERLLKQLTQKEKVAILSGRSMWFTGGVPRLNLDPLRVSDGPHGMRGFCLHGDSGAILAPCEMALAATFDESLITEVGDALGEDCARRGGHVMLGPCVNMQRMPLFGRHFECFSEDAFLSARATVAYVLGVQRHVAACAKHFVCNDQEDYRHTLNAVIDERTLHEIYLAPFEAAVREGDIECIMCGYNRLNGSYCTENSWLLQKVLRDDWGFQGWLISDWFGNQSTTPAITAGLNVEMPGIEPRHFGGYLLDAVNRGEVSENLLDVRCRPVLRTMLRHAGKPAPGASAEPSSSHAVSKRCNVLRRAAAASHVLLRNEENVLPLDVGVLRRVAVIGPFATDTVIQGGGSSRVRPRLCATILEALRSALPKGSVLHERGCYPGSLAITTPEFEALKPIGACNASGQPLGSEIPTRIFDAALYIAAGASNMECFRRYFMPVLRVLGLRQADPEEMAAQQAREVRTVGGRTQSHDSSKILGGVAIFAAAAATALACAFAAGAWSQSWPKLRIAAGAVSFAVLFGGACRCYQLSLRKRAEERLLKAAEEAAREAAVCLLVLGSSGFCECEGMDRPDMLLPGRQNELVERVAAAATGPVVVVLNVGSPKEMPWISKVSSVLLVHYGGEEMGAAVVDTLLGVNCPSGRLPMTWPRRLEDSPTIARDLIASSAKQSSQENTALLGAPASKTPTLPAPGETHYSEGLCVGYRAFGKDSPLASISPLFPFGHGLSYTTFEYGPLDVEQTSSCSQTSGPRLSVRVGIRNVGNVRGAEVVQLYTEAAPTDREPCPGPRALRAFSRTAQLTPGEETHVVFDLDARALGSSYSSQAGAWLQPVPEQVIRIEVGASSADVRSTAAAVLK